jgi:hypothetical protein
MKRRDALRSLTGGCLGFAVHGIGLRAFAQTDSSELLIRRGRVVNASGIRDADVRIVGATVAEIGVGLKPRTGARVIDAIERMAARVRAEAIADLFLHASAWPPTPEVTAAMAAIAAPVSPASRSI